MKKLIKYLSTAPAIAVSAGLQAGVVYTDVDPDIELNVNGETFDIDFNNDGNYEIQVGMDIQGGWYGPDINAAFINVVGGNQVAGYQTFPQFGPTNTNSFGSAYIEGITIDSGLDWLAGNALFGFYFDYGYQGGSEGPWAGLGDNYLAFKLTIDGEEHYGWARFDVTFQYSSVIVKDYAYNDTPGEPIETGITYDSNLVAKNIVISDVNNKHNGRDLQVSFTRANQESKIAEYRLIAVKKENVGEFSTGKANASAYYKSVKPNGNDITTTFTSASKDVDGDLIQENINYVVYVLSVPDFTQTSASNLSLSSNDTTLKSHVGLEASLFESVDVMISEKNITVLSSDVLDHITIRDLQGREVVQKLPTNKNTSINLEESPRGVYLVTVKKGNNIATKKITI